MSDWMPGWKARGWKRKAGPIENLDLWKQLDKVATRHNLAWHWVKGHAGNPRNEYANELATSAADEQTTSGGLVPSGFQAWLDNEREERGLFMDFMEFAPPEEG
jgi:ribonuclease HI